MTKYQCNVCGQVFTLKQDAINCHPDINVIEEIPFTLPVMEEVTKDEVLGEGGLG